MKFEKEFRAFRMTDIIIRSLNAELSSTEEAELRDWLIESKANRDLYEEMASQESRSLALLAMDRYPVPAALSRVQQQVKKTMGLWSKVSIAAAVLLVAGLGTLFFLQQTSKIKSDVYFSATADLNPGTNKATLTLADGKVIQLSDDKKGIVIDAIALTYNDGTAIQTPGKAQSENYQTITTPNGGTYQVRLPDGTMVWLNAASSLRFPLKFRGRDRQVELTGEGYFEVAKNKNMPFKVKTDQQELEVLGTHFNISNYKDERSTKTTLLEGAVQLKSRNSMKSETVVLAPGQQSVLTQRDIQVRKVDPEGVISWKNGFFRFDDEELESIMQKVSRWYNAEVIFKNEKLKKEPFAGIISRDTKVSELLKMLGQAGEVKFIIENNKIMVMEK